MNLNQDLLELGLMPFTDGICFQPFNEELETKSIS